MDKKNIMSMLKSILSNTVLTLISRILGLARELVRAFFLGTGAGSDAFGIAFMLPNLFRRFVGEGAMSAAFVPVFTEILEKEGKDAAREFSARFFWLLCTILLLITGSAVLLARPFITYIAARGYQDDPERLTLTIQLTRVMFPYLILVSLAAFAQGILNSLKIFWVSAAHPILFNAAVIIIALLFAKNSNEPVMAFALGVLAGGSMQILWHIPFLMKNRFLPKIVSNIFHPKIKKVLYLMVPVLLSGGVYQINVLISQLFATYLGGGAVSSLQFSIRLLELTLGVFVISVTTVILPNLSSLITHNKTREFSDTISMGLRLCAFVTFPAAAGLILLRKPIISLIYGYGQFGQRSLDLTAFALLFHAIGLFFIAGQRLYVQPFYAVKDTKTPLYSAIICLTVNACACYIFAWPLGLRQGGLALANSVSSLVQMCVLIFFLKKRGLSSGFKSAMPSLLKNIICALLTAVPLWFIASKLPLLDSPIKIRIISTLGVISAAAVLYLLISRILKCRELTEITSALFNNLRIRKI